MAALNFSSEAYFYETGLQAIKLMWVAAGNELRSRLTEIEQEYLEYERHLDRGGARIGEWDGDHRVFDEHDRCRLEKLKIDDAIVELNVATTISIYHHWERFTPEISAERKGGHSALKKAARGRGIDLHPDIDALNFTANYLKHGNHKWLGELARCFDSRFGTIDPIPLAAPAWVRRLNLDTSHIEWFFEIAAMSKRPIISTS